MSIKLRCISRSKQTHLSAVRDGVGQIKFTRALLRELHQVLQTFPLELTLLEKHLDEPFS